MQQIIDTIVERFKNDSYLIILFGSYAAHKQHRDSNLDIYIVTKDNIFPNNWTQKSQIYLKYARKISDLQKIIPIDLIVHTQPMYKKFVELQSSFSKKIFQQGIVLWDAKLHKSG
ncbi:nucleotidyltransferase domain-containing protein [Nitratiruptor sp. SB155-2]|uniref:nucleotidyltransferase domain-containing protein n=1 Tax=Nitratiruptor sp. (strain SB155-2) TaxID=387092 RepID=UPI00015873AF|nr:nucleotidyltransferase domain-containing protein [Nitratiruptor sp. SB155-2]BAF70479.1 nucleotidyltransferase [Nitratiruptor sp. SB155-2]